MKKTFLLMAAALILSSSAFAGGGFDFSIGPKVGYQTAVLSYKQADIKDGFMNHFTVGLFGRIEIGGFYIQPEALWFKTSNAFTLYTNYDMDNLIPGVNIPSGAGVVFTLNAMNIQVPVLLGYKLNVVDNLLAIRAQVGPTLNFTIPQKTLANQAIGNTTPIEVNNDVFDTKTIAFGLQGGLGVDLLKRITLDINYNFGISDMFGDLNNTPLGEYFDFHNIDNTKESMFMVTIGYKLL